VAAAVPAGFNLDEIISYKEAQLLPPGHPETKICQKIFRAWPQHQFLLASNRI